MNKIENDTNVGMKKIENELIERNLQDTTNRLVRICPDCKKPIYHKSKSAWRHGIKFGSFCKSCRFKGIRSPNYDKKYICSDETRQKLSRIMIGKTHSEESKEKIREARSRQVLTDETRKKLSESAKRRRGEKRSDETKRRISESKMGSKNPWFGKFGKEHPLSKICGEKHPLYKKHPTIETRIKMSLAKIGKTRKLTDEHKRKIRESYIKRREKLGIKFLSFNEKACNFFDNLNKNQGTHIQHALNGVEFRFRGFFADGYDPIENTWYEWDEDRHYNIDETLKQDDVERQFEIIKYLKCKFIRIKDSDPTTLYLYA